MRRRRPPSRPGRRGGARGRRRGAPGGERRDRLAGLPGGLGSGRPHPVRLGDRAARLRPAERQEDRTCRRPARQHRHEGRAPGRPALQPGRARRFGAALPRPDHRQEPTLDEDREGVRLRRLRPARRRPLGPDLLRRPAGVRQGPQGRPGPRQRGRQARPAQTGPRVRRGVRRAQRRDAAAHDDAEHGTRPGRHPGRARGEEAQLPRRLLRHLPGSRLRHPLPGPRPAHGRRQRGRPVAAEHLVPGEPEPGHRLPDALGRLEGVGGEARFRLRHRRHPAEGREGLAEAAGSRQEGAHRGRRRPRRAHHLLLGRAVLRLLLGPHRQDLERLPGQATPRPWSTPRPPT